LSSALQEEEEGEGEEENSWQFKFQDFLWHGKLARRSFCAEIVV
jgi:hypothetical protein